LAIVPASTNHTLPSGPSVMPFTELFDVGITYSAKTLPAGDIFAILFPPYSLNQMFPSDPVVIPNGRPLGVGMANSVIGSPGGSGQKLRPVAGSMVIPADESCSEYVSESRSRSTASTS